MSAHHRMPKLLICLVGVTLASAATAQAPRSNLDVAASTGAPEFRDPKTGQVWTPETVGEFLTKPKDFVKGTKMTFMGLAKPEDVANVVAYLATFSPEFKPPAQ